MPGPGTSPNRRGCDCKNATDFEGCANGAPCCQHCDIMASAYVIKWGCPIACGGVFMPALTQLWRECNVGPDTCVYTARVNPLTLVMAPAAVTSEADYTCAPLDPASRRYYGVSTATRPGYDRVIPPVWQEEFYGPYSYKLPPFKGCCYAPGESGLQGSVGYEEKSAWVDRFESCSSYSSEPAPYTLVIIRMEVTSPYSASFIIYDIYGSVVASYYCESFDCDGDTNEFTLDKATYDDSDCKGLPCVVCVSRYAKNFRTFCSSPGLVCDCCDAGAGEMTVTIGAEWCPGYIPEDIVLYRYVPSDSPAYKRDDVCSGDQVGPGEEIETLCGENYEDLISVGECGAFFGGLGSGCTYWSAALLRMWCDGEKYLMDAWCVRTLADAYTERHCYYLNGTGGPWEGTISECTCHGPVIVFSGTDFGECCCDPACDSAACCDPDTGESFMPGSLFVSFETTDTDCLPGLDGLEIECAAVSTDCNGPGGIFYWEGSGTVPGGSCPLDIAIGYIPSPVCELHVNITNGTTNVNCVSGGAQGVFTSVVCPLVSMSKIITIGSSNSCYECVADPDGFKSCQVTMHISP